MNCQDYEILIQKALDQSLSPREEAALARHLELCPDCAALMAEYSQLHQLLTANISQVEVPADLCSSVMAALPEQPPVPIRSRKKAALLRPQWRRWVGVGVAAAAVVLGFSVTSWFEQAQEPSLPEQTPILAEMPEQGDPLSQPEQLPLPQQPVEEDLPPVTQPTDAPETTNPVEPKENQTPVQQAEQPQDQPQQQTAPPVDTAHSSEIALPQVAYGNVGHGEYSLLTLAAVEGYDAILPQINGNTLTFYVETEDARLEYQVELSGAAPVFQGEVESLPSARATAGCSRNDGLEAPCVEATSAAGVTARNYGGEKQGLWLLNGEEETQLSPDGGGSLVSWSADGNKILFTDAEEHLHLYYVMENIFLELSDSPVHSFCWSQDGKTIAFSAFDSQTQHYNICKVVIP